MIRNIRMNCCRVLLAFCLVLSGSRLWAQEQTQPETKPAEGAPTQPAVPEIDLKPLLPRFSEADRKLIEKRIETGKISEQAEERRLVVGVEMMSLGMVYFGQNKNPRLLALRLPFVNLTSDTVAVRREDVELVVDGAVMPAQDAPQQVQFHSFQVGQQGYQYKDAQFPEKIEIKSASTTLNWVLFPDLPPGNAIPTMVLKIKQGQQTISIDLNDVARRQLGITVERMGPRKSLGILRITGEVNNLSAGVLCDELDKLAADRVVRAVISFKEGARTADYQLFNWLQQSANVAGRGQMGDQQHPSMPTTIRELHMVNPPQPGQGYQPNQPGNQAPGNQPPANKPPVQISNAILFGGNDNGARLHASEIDAIVSALRSAFEILPRNELVKSIGSSVPEERAAALAGGGARLANDQLALILAAIDDDSLIVQQAAIAALSHYGTEEAVGRLVSLVRRNTDPISPSAIASLAGSRYSRSHEALLRLLQDEPADIKKAIVRVLAQFPKPIWSEAIYEFVQPGREGLNTEALNALVQVGHPKLLEVLETALKGPDEALSDQALNVLIARPDRESERIAWDFTRNHMLDKEPRGSMYALINRIKDPAVIPLIQAKFDASQQKSSMIQSLATLGDTETAKFLMERHEKLQQHEKAEVLRVMVRLSPETFRELARTALKGEDGSMVSYAIQGLQEDSSPETVKLMVEALEAAKQPFVWQQLMYSLGNTGTAEARAALIKARDSGDDNKRNVAVNALQNMRYRSPAYQYYSQGQALMREKKYKEAVEQFGVAVQMDPGFSDTYADRGICQMHLEKFEAAEKDFRKCLELDPYNSIAVTGECLVLIQAGGKVDEAVKKIETARSRFENNQLFSYNAACAYGRAYERVAKDPESPERTMKLDEYKKIGLADLKKSIQLGFRDMEHIKTDPDLKAFQALPEWEETLKEASAPPANGVPAGVKGAVLRMKQNAR